MSAPLTYRARWQGIALSVTHTPGWLGTEIDHIEIQSDGRAPLPVTETGYRSHFMSAQDLAAYESPVAFVLLWLDDAASEGWLGAQLSLF